MQGIRSLIFAKLIAHLPNTSKCPKFVKQRFWLINPSIQIILIHLDFIKKNDCFSDSLHTPPTSVLFFIFHYFSRQTMKEEELKYLI